MSIEDRVAALKAESASLARELGRDDPLAEWSGAAQHSPEFEAARKRHGRPSWTDNVDPARERARRRHAVPPADGAVESETPPRSTEKVSEARARARVRHGWVDLNTVDE